MAGSKAENRLFRAWVNVATLAGRLIMKEILRIV